MSTPELSIPSEEKISAVVVCYNREKIVGTCLRALGFADEIVVVDKSSTDRSPEIARELADKVITVPWTPVVEHTRALAVESCSHPWIVSVDDDECLSVEAGAFIRAEVQHPRADVYAMGQRHYIIGVHDERCYNWPEHQIRLFRRGAIDFAPRVHGGMILKTDRLYRVPVETGVCTHHLSHRNVADWIEKTNRYTSQANRARMGEEERDLAAYAHRQIDHWLAKSREAGPDSFPAAAALLRAIYDMVDSLKSWEERHGLDGDREFTRKCGELDALYQTHYSRMIAKRSGGTGESNSNAESPR